MCVNDLCNTFCMSAESNESKAVHVRLWCLQSMHFMYILINHPHHLEGALLFFLFFSLLFFSFSFLLVSFLFFPLLFFSYLFFSPLFFFLFSSLSLFCSFLFFSSLPALTGDPVQNRTQGLHYWGMICWGGATYCTNAYTPSCSPLDCSYTGNTST